MLDESPAGALFDIDGTLSPIAPRPEDAALAPGAREALAALSERMAVVALITGRAAADARALVGDDRLLIVGNHGLEWLEPRAARSQLPPDLAERLRPVPELIRRVIDTVRRRLDGRDGVEGVIFEDKTVSATVHFRLAPDPAVAHLAIVEAVRAAVEPAVLEVREGRMAVEIRPRGVGDKGSALRTIVDRYRLRGALVFGDDRTDLDAFRAAAELRAAGRLQAFIGAVGSEDEVAPEVRDGADAVLPSPAALVELLRGLA